MPQEASQHERNHQCIAAHPSDHCYTVGTILLSFEKVVIYDFSQYRSNCTSRSVHKLILRPMGYLVIGIYVQLGPIWYSDPSMLYVTLDFKGQFYLNEFCFITDIYYLAFPRDHLFPAKALVTFAYVYDLVQTVLTTYDAFREFGFGFGNLEILNQISLLWFSGPLMIGISK